MISDVTLKKNELVFSVILCTKNTDLKKFFFWISRFKLIFPYMFSEVIKTCYIQSFNSYLTDNNGNIAKTGNTYYIYNNIPHKNMGIKVIGTTLLLHHLFCRNSD